MSLYPSIRIEGGLLGPDVLDQLFSGELSGQRSADFGLDAKRNLTDEIAAAFADARALWGVFQRRLERVPDSDPATTVTRDAWMIPFLGLLGYEPRYNPKAYEVDGLTFAISHRAGEPADTTPIHVVGIRQELGRVPTSGRPRLAPHSLVQEYLNRTEHVWGIVTNGKTLRLLRDSTFVRRQAYVEFDLPAILDEQRFQDFAALYRLMHRTRLPCGIDDASDCLLERYYAHSVEQGGRVREHLRDGVEQCLTMLANGFLRHTANDDLRRRISPNYTTPDRLTPEAFYRQLLILVYRFLFLLVSEDRGLLSADPIYREHYGVARLRRMLNQRAAFTDHDDLWQSLRVLWLVLIKDQPQPALGNQTMAGALGLAVLNGDLFAPQALDGFTISNRDLLDAFWRLAWYQESATGSPRRVNYAALDVEELGSVYESLLEFHPAIDLDQRQRPVFSFVTGSERKTTGSYYTPPELVAELIKSALEPIIPQRLQACTTQDEKIKALLSIRVCDPACGSGHFLLAAARRLGKELAKIRTGEDEPSPERVREAIRDVVSHCIYGVDHNPLAVDLCRVALWLESHMADKPLTFLDHRIRCGDSLAGVLNLDVLKQGIPDKAFDAVEGDDKALARELKRRNRDERSGVRDLFNWSPDSSFDAWQRRSRDVDSIADDSPESIRRKRQLFEESHTDPTWLRQKLACDLWAAAFFQQMTRDTMPITTSAIADHIAGRPIDPRVLGSATVISMRQRFFHWPLEFPEVFALGGFDIVLGNPPWETLSPDAKEFFAIYDVQVRFQDREGQQRIIEGLLRDSSIAARWEAYCRDLYKLVHFIKQSGRYHMFAPGNLGKGDFNVYRMFVETALCLARKDGRAAQIAPEGLYNGANCMAIRRALFETCRLDCIFGFENANEIWFKDIDTRMKFCVYVAHKGERTEAFRAAFNIRSPARLSAVSSGECLQIPVKLVKEFSPDALAIMELGNQMDIDIASKMYRWPAFGDQNAGPPNRVYMAEIHMGNDRELFDEDPTGVPVYEGRMVDQFDYRAKGYRSGRGRAADWEDLPFGGQSKSIQPQWYIARERIPNKTHHRFQQYRVGHCAVGSPTNERTLIACLIPPLTICGHSVLTLLFEPQGIEWYYPFWIAVANSYAMDFTIRSKVALNITLTIMDSLPFPRPQKQDPRVRRLVERSLRLLCTGNEMIPFWNKLAAEDWVPATTEIPGELNEGARLQLRAEIDAIVARDLFNLTKPELEYILTTFPTQQRYQEEKHGEFRSRRLILEAWDALPQFQLTRIQPPLA